MPEFLVFSDFDGTITNLGGRQAVYSPFYTSLQTNPEVGYSQAAFKSSAEVQALFKQADKRDSTFRDTFLPSAKAQACLHDLLAQDNVEFVIVSRNRKEYILEMLTYLKFKAPELEKLKIYDCEDLANGKGGVVADHLQKKANEGTLEEVSQIKVYDDDPADFGMMMNGVTASLGVDSEILLSGENASTGKFDWEAIGESIPLPVIRIDTTFAKIAQPKLTNVEYLDDDLCTAENKTTKGFLATLVEALKNLKEAVSNLVSDFKERLQGHKEQKPERTPAEEYLEDDNQTPGSP
ncbi:MAG: hypothetical protein EPN84_03515 [Legionella sp.]|nr:MAG: hypothetical protein EPN84_03515 [Legionella sp.]